MTSRRTQDRLIQALEREGIADQRVLNAMRQVPRHVFVEEALASRAYENTALPIGLGQTISQPWVVARMTEAVIEESIPEKVLEIGTGSGYQAAVLALLVKQVFTVERIDPLLRQARRRFRELGLRNIRTRHADGFQGWPEQAPFEAVMLTAAPPQMPEELLDQLAVGGRLVAPVGGFGGQRLLRITRTEDGLEEETLGDVVFVPMLPGLD